MGNEKTITEEDRIKNAVEMGKFSYELEEKREQSLLGQASQILVTLSIFFAIIVALIGSDILDIKQTSTFRMTLMILILLLSSLILVIIAQWRFTYQVMKNVDEIWSSIELDKDNYKSQIDFYKQWKYQLQSIHNSKKAINDKRVILIKTAMVVMLLALAIVIIYFCNLINFYFCKK